MKKFNITWTPANDGGAAITGHDVGYTPSGGSETVVATGSTAAAYVLRGLTDDVEYSVRVRAENSAGKGAWSSAVVKVAALPPAQTTGLTVDSTGDGTIDLSWTAPASNTAITDYRIEYTPSGGSATEVLVGSDATSYQLTGLTNDTEYSVRVAAISAGGQGDYSAAVTGTPASGPAELTVTVTGSGFAYVRFPDVSPNATTIRVTGTSGPNASGTDTIDLGSTADKRLYIVTGNDTQAHWRAAQQYIEFGRVWLPGSRSGYFTFEALDSGGNVLQIATDVLVQWTDEYNDG